MPGDYERMFLRALAWTLAFEIPVVVGFLKFGPWKVDLSWPRALGAGFAPTGLTLPYLWFLGPWLMPDRTVLMVVGELSVVAVEAVLLGLLAPLSWKRALALSFAANLVSFLSGELLPLL
jgi:hypothetical protein